MTTRLKSLRDWVAQVAQLTSPDRIHWCDGTDQEYRKLLDEMLDNGTLLELNQSTYPGCYLHRSDPEDVARVEHLTFVCTKDAADAGPNNNWKSPDEAKVLMDSCFAGCMRGRTMYVIPYCMGPIDSPYARCGVEITDSAYVVANMYLMTRIGKPALKRIEKDKTFVKGLHSTGELDPARRYIVHFPEELTIMSYGSGYGGNALLGKKCHALRIASYQARTEGWLAEHMLIVGVQSPAGDIHYLACAFPSACGKTNLAMLIPPASQQGWKVWTLGDDIAWMHLDANGQLRAINPEAGYFGVVPGTNPQTNRNAYDMIGKDTIFTNVGVTSNNDPWWEEKGSGIPTTDWTGQPLRQSERPCRASECSVHGVGEAEPELLEARGSAGRRPDLRARLRRPPARARAARLSSQRLGARRARRRKRRFGNDGSRNRQGRRRAPRSDGHEAVLRLQLRRLLGALAAFAKRSTKLPKIFHVNWFRRDASGKFLWPGFGDNLRVLRWIIDRCDGKVGAVETPIGFLPKPKRHRRQGTRRVERRRSTSCSRSIPSSGARKWRASANTSPSSAIGYRPSSSSSIKR